MQMKQWFHECYEESTPSRLEKWISEFKRGRKSTNDAER